MRQQILRSFDTVGYGSGTSHHGLADGKGSVVFAGRDHPVTVGGVFRKLVVFSKAVRAVSTTVTLYVNRVATPLSVVLATNEVQALNDVHEVTVLPGDLVGWVVTGPHVSSPGYALSVAIEFDAPEQVFGITSPAGSFGVGRGVGGALGNGVFVEFVGGSLPSNFYSICAVPGTVTSLAIHSYDGPPGASSWIALLRKNQVVQDGSGGTIDTRVVLTGSSAASIVGSIALPLAPPDHLELIIERAGTGLPFANEHVSVGIGFTPDDPRAFMLVGGSNDAITLPAGTRWKWNRSAQEGATEDMHTAPVGRTGFEVTALYVERSQAATPGTAWTHTVTRNVDNLATPGALTAIAAVVPAGAGIGSSLGSAVFGAGDLITIRIDDTGAPPSAQFHWGLGALEPPPPPPEDASLTVGKVNVSDPSTAFVIHVDGGLSPDTLALRHGESHTYTPVPPGVYGVRETRPPGYLAATIDVSTGDPADAIAIAAGDAVDVTLTNTPEPPPIPRACAMATKLSIIQGACYRLGISRVPEALGEQSREAVTMEALYDKARKEVLREHTWAFATKYADSEDDVPGYFNLVDGSEASPAVVRSDGAVEWTFAYRYPVDCLFARRLVEDAGRRFDPNQKPFRVGRTWTDDPNADEPVLFSNEPRAVLEYTADVECSEDFHDALFEDALTALLAWKAAPSLGRDAKQQQELRQDYLFSVDLAKARQEREQQQEPGGDPSWLRAR